MEPKFIDLHVHSIYSYGVDTPSRMLYEAKEIRAEIGFCDGNKFNGISGIEIYPNNKSDFKKLMKKYRDKFDYIIVHGGSETINRLAVKDDRVDILTHSSINYRDNGINSALARQAKKNGIAIEVNLREVITSKRMDRVNAIRRIKTNLMLSRKYGYDLIVGSGAKSRYELRGARQIYELLKLLGFDEEEIEAAAYFIPKKTLKKNKNRRDRNIIMEGVRVVE